MSSVTTLVSYTWRQNGIFEDLGVSPPATEAAIPVARSLRVSGPALMIFEDSADPPDMLGLKAKTSPDLQ